MCGCKEREVLETKAIFSLEPLIAKLKLESIFFSARILVLRRALKCFKYYSLKISQNPMSLFKNPSHISTIKFTFCC